MIVLIGSFRIFEFRETTRLGITREKLRSDYFQNLNLENKVNNILRRVDDHIYYDSKDESLESLH